MKICSGIRKAVIGGLCFLAGSAAFAQPAQPVQSVLAMSYEFRNRTFPAAAYRNISVAEFRSMVRKAFEASGFSLAGVDERKDRLTMQFNFHADPKLGLKPGVFIPTDELTDGKKKCNPCFLRFPEVVNAPAMKELPWMAQYDLSALLVPALDKAYATVESMGREHQDPSFGFNYKPHWTGEKNLFGNSYVGIGLPSLKDRIVRAYRSAGFLPVESDVAPRSPEFDLAFSFPIDPPKEGGAVYKVKIRGQYDADGNCFPCEITEHYNPYQPLPPAGLSGIVNRATLESRFSTARSAAYEGIRADLERYLRPRSVFSVPPKPAALGSPPPAPTAAVVT